MFAPASLILCLLSGSVFFPQPRRAAEINRGSLAGPVKTKARAPNTEEENEITGAEAAPETGHCGLRVTGFLSGLDWRLYDGGKAHSR